MGLATMLSTPRVMDSAGGTAATATAHPALVAWTEGPPGA